MKATPILGLVVLIGALAAPAARGQDFHWQGKVAAGGAVEIKDVNGSIEATGSPAGEVQVTATKHGRRSDPAAVEIKVVEHPGGVTICAVYPSRGSAPNECAPGKGGRMSTHDNDVSVEFRVKVPEGVRFVGRTVNGGITATSLSADAEAYTVNGGIRVEGDGLVRAETVNGSVRASLGKADWTGELSFKSVNGQIKVALPEGTNTELYAKTVNGAISTDFPLTVQGRFSSRRLSGTIGSGGGRRLELETVNGGIELTRRP